MKWLMIGRGTQTEPSLLREIIAIQSSPGSASMDSIVETELGDVIDSKNSYQGLQTESSI